MRRYLFKNMKYAPLVAVLDIIGSLVFLPIRVHATRCSRTQPISSILLIRLDHIGDVLLTTPALHALRDEYPTAKILALVGSWAKDVLSDNPYLDGIFTLDVPWYSRTRKSKRAFVHDLVSCMRRLREEKLDIAISFRPDVRNALLAFLSGARKTIGYDIKGGGFCLNTVVPYDQRVHQVILNFNLLALLGIRTPKDIRLEIFPSPKDQNAVDHFLKQSGISEAARLIAIHPGAGCPSKLWVEGRFARLADMLTEQRHTKVVFTGNAEESEMVHRIAGLMKNEVLVAAGRLSIKQTALLLKRCLFLITVDSAVMHMAAAMGTPTIALFSGTNRLEEWRPYGNKALIIRKDLQCSPCYLQRCRLPKHECMELITVHEVLDAAHRLAKVQFENQE